ncbi:unnamed protein product [Arctogadus glacialis]
MGENSLDVANVKVAVRVRPFNRRERELNTKCVVEMEKNQTILNPSGSNLGKGDSRITLQRNGCQLSLGLHSGKHNIAETPGDWGEEEGETGRGRVRETGSERQ